MIELIKELLLYARHRKKIWLLPIIIILLFFGSLLIFAQSSSLAPFIYTLF